MCFVDLDPCEVWQETNRKARKEHKCSCCCRTIKVGEQYLVHFSVFEGNSLSDKCCDQCEGDRAEFALVHDGVLCTPHALPDMVRSCIGEGGDDTAWEAMLARIWARRLAG